MEGCLCLACRVLQIWELVSISFLTSLREVPIKLSIVPQKCLSNLYSSILWLFPPPKLTSLPKIFLTKFLSLVRRSFMSKPSHSLQPQQWPLPLCLPTLPPFPEYTFWLFICSCFCTCLFFSLQCSLHQGFPNFLRIRIRCNVCL